MSSIGPILSKFLKNVTLLTVTASALNRSKFPWEVPGNTAASIASSTTTSTTSDNVYKAASSVLRRSSSLSPFHQVSLSGESQLAGEPDKSIKRNEAAEQPPTIIEEDIATDLEEVLSFNPRSCYYHNRRAQL